MIKDTGKTLPKIIDTSPTLPKVDPAKVAKELGTEEMKETKYPVLIDEFRYSVNAAALKYKQYKINDELLKQCRAHYDSAFRYLGIASLHLGFWITLAILQVTNIISANTTWLLIILSIPTMYWFYSKSSREYNKAKRDLSKLEKYE